MLEIEHVPTAPIAPFMAGHLLAALPDLDVQWANPRLHPAARA
jgi:hypothetical protein